MERKQKVYEIHYELASREYDEPWTPSTQYTEQYFAESEEEAMIGLKDKLVSEHNLTEDQLVDRLEIKSVKEFSSPNIFYSIKK